MSNILLFMYVDAIIAVHSMRLAFTWGDFETLIQRQIPHRVRDFLF